MANNRPGGVAAQSSSLSHAHSVLVCLPVSMSRAVCVKFSAVFLYVFRVLHVLCMFYS